MIKKILLILLLITTPLWAETEIYFTGQDNVEAKIIEKINEAEDTILIAMYSFTNKRLYEALRGSDKFTVKIILDKVQNSGKYSIFNPNRKTTNTGIYIARYPFLTKIMRGFSGGIMHNKICIIDDKYLLTGSYNWTTGAEHKNYENLVIIDDPKIIKQAIEYYQKLWEK